MEKNAKLQSKYKVLNFNLKNRIFNFLSFKENIIHVLNIDSSSFKALKTKTDIKILKENQTNLLNEICFDSTQIYDFSEKYFSEFLKKEKISETNIEEILIYLLQKKHKNLKKIYFNLDRISLSSENTLFCNEDNIAYASKFLKLQNNNINEFNILDLNLTKRYFFYNDNNSNLSNDKYLKYFEKDLPNHNIEINSLIDFFEIIGNMKNLKTIKYDNTSSYKRAQRIMRSQKSIEDYQDFLKKSFKNIISNNLNIENLVFTYAKDILSENIIPTLSNFLSNLLYLKTLDLSKSHIGDIENGINFLFEGLKHNLVIEELNLTENNIGEAEIDQYPKIADFLIANNSLKILNLSHNSFTASNIYTFFSAVEKNKNLKKLKLKHVIFKDNHLAFDVIFKTLTVNKTLEELNIKHCYLNNNKSKLELKSEDFFSLKILKMGYNKIYLNKFSKVLNKCFNLNKLNIESCLKDEIENETLFKGLIYFLKNAKYLTYIKINKNQLNKNTKFYCELANAIIENCSIEYIKLDTDFIFSEEKKTINKKDGNNNIEQNLKSYLEIIKNKENLKSINNIKITTEMKQVYVIWLLKVLQEKIELRHLELKNLEIGYEEESLSLLCSIIINNKFLEKINLSDNLIGKKDEYIDRILYAIKKNNNETLKILLLKNNEIKNHQIKNICRFLIENKNIEIIEILQKNEFKLDQELYDLILEIMKKNISLNIFKIKVAENELQGELNVCVEQFNMINQKKFDVDAWK